MEIQNKKIIITGAAGGIGQKTVEELAKSGAQIIALDINEKALADMKKSGVACHVCDVTDEGQIEKTLSEVEKIDVLINNAGIVSDSALFSIMGGIKMHDTETWHKTIATNLTSVFLMTRAVVKKMFEQRTKGLIINVSSVAASGNPGQSAYSAAKAGVNALTHTWANELNYLGIRVAAIAPGFTAAGMSNYAMNDKLREEWKKKIPLKRLAAAEEIASGIKFIIENDYFHGKVLEIDGGLVI